MMKSKHIITEVMRVMTLALLSAVVVLFSSCDEHEPIDLDIHPGHILLDDGTIISPEAFDASVHSPVAVVFATETDKHPALAVLLDEVRPLVFCDTLSFVQNTSCDVTAFDGYVNTVALQTTYVARDSQVVKDYKADPRNYYGSPLGLSAFRSHYFAQSDYVPSIAELGLLYLSLGRVNPVIERCGGTPVATTSDAAGCWYWSSTEVAENQVNQAWLFSMADGSRHRAPKTNAYHARLIVEYNPLNINY